MASNKLLVITPCTRTHDAGTLDILRSQLAAAEIPHHIHIMPPNPPLGSGMATKISMYRGWCEQFGSRYDNFVISDAFDVCFFGHSEDEVVARIPTDYVLCAAEKNCYPDPSLAPKITELYPERGPARYFNGGLTAGTPSNIMRWLDAMENHQKYLPHALDQWHGNEWLAEGGSPLFDIDWQSKLFFCLFGGYSELKFGNGEPVNMDYDTRPNFVHSNGGWNNDEMWRKYEESLA